MKKKTIVIIIGFLLLLGLMLLSSLLRKETTKEETTPTANIPVPQITNFVKGSFVIESNIIQEDFNFPDSASFLELEPAKPWEESEILNIAKNAGFNEKDYITSKDIKRGITYIFKGQGETLTVYSRTNQISYVKEGEQAIINKQLTNDAIIQIAKDFLNDKSLSDNNKLSFSFITFMKIGPAIEHVEIVPKEEATVYVVNFVPVDSDIKLVDFNPFTSMINVWVLPDGSVTKAEIINSANTSFTEEKYPLKDYSDFVNSVQNATMVNLDDGNVFMGDLSSGSVEKVTIEKIELAYFRQNNTSNIYQPIFLLNASAELTGYEEPVNAVLYLPAIKTP